MTQARLSLALAAAFMVLWAWSATADALEVEYVLPRCDVETVWIGDGSTCVSVALTNTSSDPNSNQTYQASYKGGTKATDTGNGPGQGAVFNCNLLLITAHETAAPTGKVKVTT